MKLVIQDKSWFFEILFPNDNVHQYKERYCRFLTPVKSIFYVLRIRIILVLEWKEMLGCLYLIMKIPYIRVTGIIYLKNVARSFHFSMHS